MALEDRNNLQNIKAKGETTPQERASIFAEFRALIASRGTFSIPETQVLCHVLDMVEELEARVDAIDGGRPEVVE